VLDVLLDSWDRNNAILLNLLGALPPGGLGARACQGCHSVAELFTHIGYVRLVLVSENAPEIAPHLAAEEWVDERDPARIADVLNESARAVRDAVQRRIESGRAMDRHYDHPVLMLQHLLWHEAYHHGQIKLTLKLAGLAMSNAVAGPLTWRVWMNKR
jgi:uncharacterized damage-inducible protein DinB